MQEKKSCAHSALPQKYFLSGPRSGPNENSPALQRWDRDRMSPKSAKRTAEKLTKSTRLFSRPLARTWLNVWARLPALKRWAILNRRLRRLLRQSPRTLWFWEVALVRH